MWLLNTFAEPKSAAAAVFWNCCGGFAFASGYVILRQHRRFRAGVPQGPAHWRRQRGCAAGSVLEYAVIRGVIEESVHPCRMETVGRTGEIVLGVKMMWIVVAFGSAFFAGVTSILAKCGIRKTDSTVATAIRTIVVLIFSWLMVFVVGSQKQIGRIEGKTLLFLVLSGLATGASWLCYFKALQLGDINKVVPIDKSSTILTILLAFLFLHEAVSLPKIIGVVLIAIGTFLMIEKRDVNPGQAKGKGWLLYAVGAAVFASLTSILGKVGISGVESNLGTAIRTVVVLAMSWVMVFATGKQKTVRNIPKKELGFICLSGLATGASWLCYYRALQDGLASVVVPIDKLSILVTILFSYLVFRERLSKRAFAGLLAIVVGTLVMLIP